jgi:hypothetical protein
MPYLDLLLKAISTEMIRGLTGKLFTDDQIRSLTQNAVLKYFTDWFPEPGEEKAARERVEEARNHIGKASAIIAAMQTELTSQTGQLDKLLREIEEKKRLAGEYAARAAISEEHFAVIRGEIEDALRQQLVAQSEKGKGVRRAVSLFIWLVTLLLGAALGTYFKEVIAWLKLIAARFGG